MAVVDSGVSSDSSQLDPALLVPEIVRPAVSQPAPATADALTAIRTWPPTSTCPRCGQPNGRWQFDDRANGEDTFRCLACCQVWANASIPGGAV